MPYEVQRNNFASHNTAGNFLKLQNNAFFLRVYNIPALFSDFPNHPVIFNLHGKQNFFVIPRKLPSFSSLAVAINADLTKWFEHLCTLRYCACADIIRGFLLLEGASHLITELLLVGAIIS